MFMPRKLIPILACIGLAGCVTYPNDGYFYSPDISSYGGDNYYGDNNGYDEGYYGNYGNYEYYGAQPNITFNFIFNYGYSGYSGYYPYYGYYDYRPCSAWSSFCYAYRPNYGWGYWPVYVYRPHHHHHDNHHHKGNKKHDDDNHQGNQPDQSDDIAQDRPTRPTTRPNEPVRVPRQNRTPSVPLGNSPYVDTRPTRPAAQQRPEYADQQPRYRIPQNVQQPRPEQTEREAQLADPDNRKYVRVPRYSIQQAGLESQEREEHIRAYRNSLNQNYGEPNDTEQQQRPEPQDRQRQNGNGSRKNYASLPQPVQTNRGNVSTHQNQVVQQPQPQAKQVRVEKSERRESKKAKNDDE